jgi:hypothetical protein
LVLSYCKHIASLVNGSYGRLWSNCKAKIPRIRQEKLATELLALFTTTPRTSVASGGTEAEASVAG